ncbi:MAG TPA: hypothetical protein VHN82_05295 [Methanoregula sp.]|nr:hypothetical protein [Methanoregula sp.]
MARQVYDLFHLPLVTIVYVRTGEQYLLSSLSPVKSSHLSDEEREILSAYLSNQELRSAMQAHTTVKVHLPGRMFPAQVPARLHPAKHPGRSPMGGNGIAAVTG